MEEVPVLFTLAELWLLNDVVRHDVEKGDVRERAGYPVVSTQLNEEIALAIDVGVTLKVQEQALLLTHSDLLLIDACVRRDMRTPEGASGKDILLKTFSARAKLASGFLGHWPVAWEKDDISYKDAVREEEVTPHAEPSDSPDKSPDVDALA